MFRLRAVSLLSSQLVLSALFSLFLLIKRVRIFGLPNANLFFPMLLVCRHLVAFYPTEAWVKILLGLKVVIVWIGLIWIVALV